MSEQRYVMCDLSGDKVDNIMDFDLVLRRPRSRSVFEFSLFLVAVLGYLTALGLSG